MKIEDIIYFSKNFRFRNIDWSDKTCVIKAFEDRVSTLYLEPVKELDNNKYFFASGVICVTIIDFLSRIERGSKKTNKKIFIDWLEKNIIDFSKKDMSGTQITRAEKFYDDFRCGLVHQGCIKAGGLFSDSIGPLVIVDSGLMVVNPRKLLNELMGITKKYIERLKRDDTAFDNLMNILNEDFKVDIARTKRVLKSDHFKGGGLQSHTFYPGTR